jgi:hypothetical protein
MGPPFAFKMVREFGSEKWLPGGAAGKENRHKRPTLIEGRMFIIIWKSYIWTGKDILKNEVAFGYDQDWNWVLE